MRLLTIGSAALVLLFGAGCVEHESEIAFRVKGTADSADIAAADGFDSEIGPYRRYKLPWVQEGSVAQSHYLWTRDKRITFHVVARVPPTEKVIVGIDIDGELRAADTAFGTAEAQTYWP